VKTWQNPPWQSLAYPWKSCGYYENKAKITTPQEEP